MPSKYTPELFQEILENIAQGIPLEEICRRSDMPSSQAVYSWMRGELDEIPKETAAKMALDFAHARDLGFDEIAHRTRKTARGLTPENGGDSTLDVQRDKLIIETDLKLLSKWSKKYSERVGLENVEDKPFKTQEVTDHEGAARKLAAMMAVMAMRKGNDES